MYNFAKRLLVDSVLLDRFTGVRKLSNLGFATFGAISTFNFSTLKAVRSAVEDPCTGPFQSNHCHPDNCDGSHCQGYSSTHCDYVSGYCVGSNPCWESFFADGMCCDCECVEGGDQWYCYCFGGGS
jgi:hypothetical protein